MGITLTDHAEKHTEAVVGKNRTMNTSLFARRASTLGLLTAAAAGLLCAGVAQTVEARDKTNQGIRMMAFPPAKNAGLQDATGSADVDVKGGTVDLKVELAPGTSVPKGTVLEGWLSTSGKDTASDADQKYGPAFGKKDVADKSRAIPYALSTGVLHQVGHSRTYVGHFHIDNELTPYGSVAVTLESDGNKGNYDPRAGTPFLGGMIKD